MDKKRTLKKKLLDVIIKEYVSAKAVLCRNNMFATISKKIYEIPTKIKDTFQFLGTLKRKFFVSRYKKKKPGIEKLKNIKKKVEVYKPTAIERESHALRLQFRRTLFKFKLNAGLFYFKRLLILTKLWYIFDKADYKFDDEMYKVDYRMYRWEYRARKPRVKSKLWKRLLKKMKFKKKKLFNFIKKFKLFKKLQTFDILFQRSRLIPTVLYTRKRYNIITKIKQKMPYLSNFFTAFSNLCSFLKKEFTKKTIMTFKNNQDKKDIGSFFYALKRRLPIT